MVKIEVSLSICCLSHCGGLWRLSIWTSCKPWRCTSLALLACILLHQSSWPYETQLQHCHLPGQPAMQESGHACKMGKISSKEGLRSGSCCQHFSISFLTAHGACDGSGRRLFRTPTM